MNGNSRWILVAATSLVFIMAALVAGWSPAWNEKPRIPTAGLYAPGVGRCVALYEGGTMIGYVINRTEDMRRADKNRDGYAISTYNSVTLIAQQAGRPDLASLAVDLQITDGPSLDSQGPPIGCYCENTIWSGDPRKGGKVTGCGGACGSCTHCVVKTIQ